MWRIWFFFGILEISFGAPVNKTNQEGPPSSELVVLKCLLSSPLNSCDDVKRTVEKIPKRIQKLYEKLKKPLTDVASNDVFDIDALDTVPITLLYLIPKIRLYSMSGTVASNIIKKFPLDDALTAKILGLLNDDKKIQDFLNGLSKYDESFISSDYDTEEETALADIPFISPAVEEEIGVALSKWFPNGSHWEFWLFEASMMSGSPLLANLPNYFLNGLPLKTTEKFLFHLRNWRWDHMIPSFYDGFSSSSSLWTRHSMALRRIWAHVALTKAEEPSRWSPRILKQLGFLLTGATPDELGRLPSSLKLSPNFRILINLNWNPLQARAVFDVLYHEITEMNEIDLMNLENNIVNLLPRQLLQFSTNKTNFDFIMKSDEKISLATKKQIFEMQLAYKFLNHTKDVFHVPWNRSLVLGKFFHLVPASHLKSYINESYDVQDLSKIESSYLTYRQVRYLTKSNSMINFNPMEEEVILSLKSLLKSMPSIKLSKIRWNKIPKNIKEHLLMFTSGDSPAAMASILEKVRSDFAHISLLEKILYNKDYSQYFNLLGSRDISQKFQDISSNLFILINKDPNLERNVRLLPYNTLFALLSYHRQDAIKVDGGWTYENLIDSPMKMYISGLSCLDIRHLELSDFMAVFGYYVRHRRALGQVFPKNMQHCSQVALLQYLKLKANLRGTEYETMGLLDLLESYEIKAVGGYILAGFPTDAIISLPRKQQIISEIGKLTIPELLTANSLANVKFLANSYYQEPITFQLKTIGALGNLIWFLSSDNIKKINVADFKLFIESLEENSIKALCFNQSERYSWKLFLMEIFGNPDSWSPGILSLLGDLLIVFDNYDLKRINRTTWTESADVLSQTTSFFRLVEWPGKTKPIHFYKVCLEILEEPERSSFKSSLKNLLRFHLEAAQFLLDTVISSEHLLKSKDPKSNIEGENAIGVLHFIPSLLTREDSNSSFIVETFNSTNNEMYDNITDASLKITTESAEAYEEEKNFSDMIQGDQEFEEDEDEDDYDYANDYSYGDNTDYLEHENKQESGSNYQLNEGNEFLTEAEASEKAKEIFKRLNIFNIFITKDENVSSSQQVKTNQRERRSIKSSEGGSIYEKSSSIVKSQDLKSLEEKKEDLRVNGSRNLVIEMPVNDNESGEMDLKHGINHQVKISCDAIRILGKSASLALEKRDIGNLSDIELEDCSETLGNLELSDELKKDIWRRLKEWKESGNLLEVGNIVSVIEEREISDIKLDLSEPWAYENLDSLARHITDPILISQASDEFLLKNMKMSALSYEVAASLGRLVCTMTLAHQKKLLISQPHVFVNVAPILGNTIECNNKIFESCIHQLAKISVSEQAFGKTSNWDANDVSTLGVIVAGLSEDDWNDGNANGLRPEALWGLTPSAASCMPSETLQILSEEQLSHIPPMSVAVLSAAQTSRLTPSQFAALNGARRQMSPEELRGYTSAGTRSSFTLNLTLTIFVFFNYFIARKFS